MPPFRGNGQRAEGDNIVLVGHRALCKFNAREDERGVGEKPVPDSLNQQTWGPSPQLGCFSGQGMSTRENTSLWKQLEAGVGEPGAHEPSDLSHVFMLMG